MRLWPLPSAVALLLLAALALVLVAGISAAELSPHAPISIDGNAGFTSSNGVVSGNGSKENPYVIEWWSISGASVDGVRIQNTDAHFVLRRIVVQGPGKPGGYGIWMNSVKNAAIENSSVVDMAYGVHIANSRWVVVDNLTATDGATGVEAFLDSNVLLRNVMASGFNDGIVVRQSRRVDVDRCSAVLCSRYGIYLVGIGNDYTSGVKLTGCNASGNGRGAVLWMTDNIRLTGCTVTDNLEWDIHIDDCDGAILDRNTMGKMGLYVDHYDIGEIDATDTNTVDGKPLRYLKLEMNVTLDRPSGQVILYRCANITVANQTFDGVRQPVCIDTSERCGIVNCTIRGAFYGILSTVSGTIAVDRVRIEGWSGSYTGILAPEANITDSNISGGEIGISVSTAVVSNTTVWNCSNIGIGVSFAVILNTSVWDCSVAGIRGTGIWQDWNVWRDGSLYIDDCRVASSGVGISLYHMMARVNDTEIGSPTGTAVRDGILARESAVLWVTNCEFVRCQDCGARFVGCRDVWVRSNRFSGASSVGVLLDRSGGALVGNDFSGATVPIAIRTSPNTLVSNCTLAAGGSAGPRGVEVNNSRGCVVTGCEVAGFVEGIELVSAPECEVRRCDVRDCERGLDVTSSSDVLVTECTIRGCAEAAMVLTRSEGAFIHHNNLVGSCYDDGASRYWGHQAYDDSDLNQWDDGAEGNYWEDFVQWYPNAKPRGRVWDTPYDIWGLNATVDRYPLTLMVDIRPPVADAGPDQTVGENTRVTLDGSASTDDNGIVGYTWTFVHAGQPVSLLGMVANHTFGPLGTYEVVLTVRDAWGNVGTDTMLVIVIDMVPPVAVAGLNITVNVDEPFTLDGSGSHDDHGIASYRWAVDPGGLDLTFDSVVAALSIGAVGDYVAVLNVTDAQGNWATDSLVVRVRDLSPPVADAGPDVEVDQHGTVTLDGSGSSDNVGVVLWSWSFRYGGEDVVLGDTAVEFTFDLAGLYQVVLTVSDSALNSAQDVMFVRVRDTEPPVADAGPDITVPQGETVELVGTGSHDNVGVVGYTWTLLIGAAIEAHEGAVVSVAQLDVGVYTVTLNVTDAAGNWGTDTAVVTVRDTRPPSAEAGPDVVVDQHAAAVLDATGSEDDVGIVSFVWTFRDAAADVVLEGPIATHVFDAAGVYEVTLTVADAAGNAASDRLSVRVRDIEPPVAVAPSDRTAVEGDELLLDGGASHDNVGVVAFVWTVRAGEARTVHVGPVLRVPTGAPGELRIELRVEDAAQNSATDTLVVIVLPLNITWRLGPFMDEDDRFVEGARVRVTMNGTVYEGHTDETGWLAALVLRFDAVERAEVIATKAGYEELRFTTRLDADGRAIDPVPRMRRVPDVSAAAALLWWLLLVAVVACAVAAVILYRQRRERGPPGA